MKSYFGTSQTKTAAAHASRPNAGEGVGRNFPYAVDGECKTNGTMEQFLKTEKAYHRISNLFRHIRRQLKARCAPNYQHYYNSQETEESSNDNICPEMDGYKKMPHAYRWNTIQPCKKE